MSGMNPDRSRASNPSMNKSFAGNASWNANIWGDNTLGNGFAEGMPNAQPSALFPLTVLDQRAADTSLEGKSGSGSLLSTSESDGWGRPHLPWSSSIPFGQHKAMSRPNDRSAPALAEPSDPSYFALPRTSMAPSTSGNHKSFLSGPEGISPSGDGFGGFSGFKSGDRRHANTSAFGSGLSMRGFPGALDTPRSEDVGSMNTSLPQGTEMPQPLARPYAHMPHNSASFAQRPVHSATPSFHSESQGLDSRYGGGIDINSGLNRLQINDGSFQRPQYLSHASYDGSVQRLKYPDVSGDGYQMAGYGESPQNLPLAYQAGKSHIGEDSIADYTRMESPFYSGVDSSAVAPHYRNGSGSRLSDGQVALERKLRGLQQEEYPANPLQRVQLPQTYDFSGYHASRLNTLSGYYPVAHIGALGATSMASRAHRDNDPAQVVRSPLLEEFRANSKGNKRYDLKVRSLAYLISYANPYRTFTTMSLSSVVTSTDRGSFSKSWRPPTATRKNRCSARSSRIACS